MSKASYEETYAKDFDLLTVFDETCARTGFDRYLDHKREVLNDSSNTSDTDWPSPVYDEPSVVSLYNSESRLTRHA